MKRLVMVLTMCFVLAAFGCASMTKVDHSFASKDDDLLKIDDRYTLVVVKSRDILSPSLTTLMVYDKESGTFSKVEGGIGNGFLGVMAQPAATAYAGERIGDGLKESGDQYTDNSKTKTVAGAESASGSAAGAISGSSSSARGGSAFQSQGQHQGQGQLQGQGQTTQHGLSNRNTILDF